MSQHIITLIKGMTYNRHQFIFRARADLINNRLKWRVANVVFCSTTSYALFQNKKRITRIFVGELRNSVDIAYLLVLTFYNGITWALRRLTWWRHQMETFSSLLALCAGNSPVIVEVPAQRPVTLSSMLSLICVWINDWVNNHEACDLRRHRAHYDVIVMKSPATWHTQYCNHNNSYACNWFNFLSRQTTKTMLCITGPLWGEKLLTDFHRKGR